MGHLQEGSIYKKKKRQLRAARNHAFQLACSFSGISNKDCGEEPEMRSTYFFPPISSNASLNGVLSLHLAAVA